MEGRCYVELLVSDLLPDARIAQDFDGLISAFGRLPETTKGCFVEAKSEKPCLGIRPVWRISVGWFGSCGDRQLLRFIAGKLSLISET